MRFFLKHLFLDAAIKRKWNTLINISSFSVCGLFWLNISTYYISVKIVDKKTSLCCWYLFLDTGLNQETNIENCQQKTSYYHNEPPTLTVRSSSRRLSATLDFSSRTTSSSVVKAVSLLCNSKKTIWRLSFLL